MTKKAGGKATLYVFITGLVSLLLTAVAFAEINPAAPYFQKHHSELGTNQSRLLLAILTLNGKEISQNIELEQSEGHALSVALTPLLSTMGLRGHQNENGRWIIDTPLGQAHLEPREITQSRGQTFAPLPLLSARMGCRIHFDEAEFALIIDTPWQDTSRTNTGTPVDASLLIDVSAPKISFSQWRTEFIALYSAGTTSESAVVDVGGALGEGYWQGEFSSNFSDQPNVQNLSWITDRGASRWLVGQQRVALHPLLPGFDLSGVQMAYANTSDYLHDQSSWNGQLVPYQAAPLSRIRGEGPPGGVAELRLAGHVIARQPIGLDGHYEFRNISPTPSDTGQLQIAIYEFRDMGTPLRVEEVYPEASSLQTPKGTWIQFMGVGANGRAFDAQDPSNGNVGFYQIRYGVREGLTLDALAQTVDGQHYAVTGAAFSLGRLGNWAAYTGIGNKHAISYQLLGDGQWKSWFWRAHWLHQDADYRDTGGIEHEARYGELGKYFGSTLRLSGIYGLFTDQNTTQQSFAGVAADWRPMRQLTFNVRPDYQGNYAYSAGWYPTNRAHLSLTRFANRTEALGEYTIKSNYRLLGSIFEQENGERRHALLLNRGISGPSRITWTVGALHGQKSTGYFVEGGMELWPGLSARLQALKDPLNGFISATSPSFTLSIIGDFAVTGSGLARGGFSPEFYRTGGISGVLQSALPTGMNGQVLSNIDITLDGQSRARTDNSGHFYIGNLKPGIYRLGLDPDNLPIELSGPENTRNIEVRAGATTRVDFKLALRLGCAGRVFGYSPQQTLRVVAMSSDGKIQTEAKINASGYFRIDGLSPGPYRLVLQTENNTQIPLSERVLELTDHFLFGQDFHVKLLKE